MNTEYLSCTYETYGIPVYSGTISWSPSGDDIAPCDGVFDDWVKLYKQDKLPSKLSKQDKKCPVLPEIEKVVHNNPATIVFWSDGSKTVVKCQEGDTYSEEVGLVFAIAKKALGNEGNYNETLKKWCKA